MQETCEFLALTEDGHGGEYAGKLCSTFHVAPFYVIVFQRRVQCLRDCKKGLVAGVELKLEQEEFMK